jgi:hypothetical protein
MDRVAELASAPQAGEPDARIVAPAIAPKEPHYPRLALICAIALGGAPLLGAWRRGLGSGDGGIRRLIGAAAASMV